MELLGLQLCIPELLGSNFDLEPRNFVFFAVFLIPSLLVGGTLKLKQVVISAAVTSRGSKSSFPLLYRPNVWRKKRR
jgi:hypothetical protein